VPTAADTASIIVTAVNDVGGGTTAFSKFADTASIVVG
jgi:hypothetical protein